MLRGLNQELETFGRTKPKKIPKDAVMSYVERNMVAITIDRPRAGGDPDDAPGFDENYPDHEEEPDEDQWYDEWSEIQESHWADYYTDNLDRVYEEHKWNKFRDEEKNEEIGEWDGTSPEDMEETARELTVEEIEGEYYEEARTEWIDKNSSKEWYSGEYNIRSDTDGDYVVSFEGEELGYDANFESAPSRLLLDGLEARGGRFASPSEGTLGEAVAAEPVFGWIDAAAIERRGRVCRPAEEMAEQVNRVAYVVLGVIVDVRCLDADRIGRAEEDVGENADYVGDVDPTISVHLAPLEKNAADEGDAAVDEIGRKASLIDDEEVVDSVHFRDIRQGERRPGVNHGGK